MNKINLLMKAITMSNKYKKMKMQNRKKFSLRITKIKILSKNL